jgi:DNA-binding CsgD family transcriptional regulator
LAGQPARASALADEVVRGGGPAVLTAGARGLMGTIVAQRGSLQGARDTLLTALDALGDADPAPAVELLADTVNVCFYLADATTLDQALARLDALLVDPMPAGVRVLGELAAGFAQVLLGGAAGLARIEAAVARPGVRELADDEVRLRWQYVGALFLRDAGLRSRDPVRQGLDGLRTRAAVGTLPGLLFVSATDDAATDRWAAADSSYHEGIRLAREVGQPVELAMLLAGLARLEARSGRLMQCRDHAAEASELSRRHDVHLAGLWSLWASGEAAVVAGDAAKGLDTFERLAAGLTSRGLLDADLWPGPELTDGLLRVGRDEAAATAAIDYHERAKAKGSRWALARAERGLGATCSADDMDRHFSAALALHSTGLDEFERCRTLLAYGSRLRRDRRRVEARGPLRDAVHGFDRLGSGLWADIADAELRATGETVLRAGSGVAELLTPQELQIARLLVAGRTTREAAAALFLSPKTIEYHLRHVYTKLDIGSRSELATALQGEPAGDRAPEPGPGPRS